MENENQAPLRPDQVDPADAQNEATQAEPEQTKPIDPAKDPRRFTHHTEA